MSSQTTGSIGFYEFLAWLEENKKNLVLAAAGLVVLGSGIAVYRWNKAQTELAASDALLALRLPLNAPEKTPPPEAAKFLKVASDFPGTTTAQRAVLLAAGALFGEGKYQEARAQFENYLLRFGDHALAPTALYGKAAALEAEGKSGEALRAYQDVIARYPKAWLIAETRLAIARIYEATKQPQLALQMYDEITRTNLMTATSGEAMTRRERLLSSHPELVKTPPPPAATTNAPPPVMPSAATNAGTNSSALSATNSTSAPATNPPAAGTNAIKSDPSPK